jgi:small-conductance mechanosensitive channel
MQQMEQIVQVWLLHPFIGKLAGAAALALAILLGVRLIKKSLSRYVEDFELRYRLRKAVNVVGAIVALIGLTSIFSVRFSQFTVAIGVAGAGVAFTLQKVIASVAVWLAVSFGKFYRPGDRIQLGGIRGDVMTWACYGQC